MYVSLFALDEDVGSELLFELTVPIESGMPIIETDADNAVEELLLPFMFLTQPEAIMTMSTQAKQSINFLIMIPLSALIWYYCTNEFKWVSKYVDL